MVPMRRALRLVLDGKAEIVESDPGRLVRSERLTPAQSNYIKLFYGEETLHQLEHIERAGHRPHALGNRERE